METFENFVCPSHESTYFPTLFKLRVASVHAWCSVQFWHKGSYPCWLLTSWCYRVKMLAQGIVHGGLAGCLDGPGCHLVPPWLASTTHARKTNHGCLELGHGFLATGLYGLVGMDHIWRHLVGHVAGGPLGLQPLGWCTKAGCWGSAVKSRKQQHTTHVHRKVWQALLIERRKHMPAIWLMALTTKHMCSKHVQFQYKRNSKHGKHAGPISIQQKFKAWQACWIHGNGFVIVPHGKHESPWVAACSMHMQCSYKWRNHLFFYQINYLANSNKPS